VRKLPLRSPGGAWLSAVGLVLVCVAMAETWAGSHLALLSGAVYLVVLSLAYLFVRPGARRMEN